MKKVLKRRVCDDFSTSDNRVRESLVQQKFRLIDNFAWSSPPVLLVVKRIVDLLEPLEPLASWVRLNVHRTRIASRRLLAL